MSAVELSCPRCRAAVRADDQFCPSCGLDLAERATGAEGGEASVNRRPWYRRKLVIVPLVIVVVMSILAGGLYYYLDLHFSRINSVSTPPPVITGSQLGGDDSVQVDTGPAQEAVRKAREAESEQPTQEPQGSSDAGAGILTLSDPADEAAPTNGKAFVASALQSDGDSGAGTATPDTLQLPHVDTGDAILVLLMGVDARPGEAIDVGVRPDTLVVLNLDPKTHSCRMLAIPRDSRVDLPGYGPSKVNHALAIGGIPYEMLVVENLLGVKFQHYGLIDFAGVKDLVDELGGITVDNKRAFSLDGHDFPEGKIKLNGEEALAYVRYRGDEEGDFGRQKRQQDVVRAILREGADLDVVTAIPQLLDSVSAHIRTDASLKTLVDLGEEFHSTCTAETLETMRMTGDVATLHDAVFNEPLSFVVLTEDEVRTKLHWLLTGEEPPSATPAASPVASPVASPAALAEPAQLLS